MPAQGKSALTVVPPLIENGKLAWVVSLRQAFQSSITDKNLKYDPDKSKSKLMINTMYPRKFEFPPAVVVGNSGGDMSFTYLQDDFVEESSAEGAALYAGRLVVTISLTILAKSTVERERILDHLIIFIRHLFTDVLRGYGQTVTRDIRVGPETLIEIENEPAFEQVIDIPVYMEYRAIIDQSAFEYIRKINLTATAVDLTE